MKLFKKFKSLPADKQKHRLACIVTMFVFSIVSIVGLSYKDGFILNGAATILDIIIGLAIGASVTYLIWTVGKEYWHDKKKGKGVFDKGDIKQNMLGIRDAAILIVIMFVVIYLFN